LYGPSIWDDVDKLKNISYFNVMMKRCQNSSETTETASCSTPEEIDDWLEGK